MLVLTAVTLVLMGIPAQQEEAVFGLCTTNASPMDGAEGVEIASAGGERVTIRFRLAEDAAVTYERFTGENTGRAIRIAAGDQMGPSMLVAGPVGSGRIVLRMEGHDAQAFLAAFAVAETRCGPRTPAAGQATPEDLANAVLAAIAAEDAAGIRALMHPSAIGFAGDERVSATVRSVLGKTSLGVAPGQDRGPVAVRVVPNSNAEGYDAKAGVYGLGPLLFEFPPDVLPTHFLSIDRTEVRSSAPDRVTLTGSGLTEGIARRDGRWYLTVSRLRR